jgi:hypothetical protein
MNPEYPFFSKNTTDSTTHTEKKIESEEKKIQDEVASKITGEHMPSKPFRIITKARIL